MKNKTILICLSALLLILCIVYYPSSSMPPSWGETHILFDSDEEMLAYGDYLTFNTEGLIVSSAYRCLSFESPQHLDLKSWSLLQVSYRIDDTNELSMLVYPNELTTTNGFPVLNLEIKELNLEGISIQYQEFRDQHHSFRALFISEGYTYELTVYSPSNPLILNDYLARIIL